MIIYFFAVDLQVGWATLNRAFSFKGNSLIKHVICELENICGRIILAVKYRWQEKSIRRILADSDGNLIFSYDSSIDSLLGGVLGGLKYVDERYVFVTGADMPLIKSITVSLIMNRLFRGGVDAVVSKWSNGYLEPLHSGFSAFSLRRVLEGLDGGSISFRRVIGMLGSVLYVSCEKLVEMAGCNIFFNVNSPSNLQILNVFS